MLAPITKQIGNPFVKRGSALKRTAIVGVVSLFFALSCPVSAVPNVQVTERVKGESRELIVRTTDLLDATVLINVTGKNIRTSVPTPVILDTAGRNDFVALTVSQDDPQKAWEYKFQYAWRTGGHSGKPDAYRYSSPFKAGADFKVSQGYLGSFSHKECTEDQYAIDWTMPEGTPVCAARDGTVVAVRQDSTVTGGNERSRSKANYITVRHADGTYGDYVHLKTNGALVKTGDQVSAGQQIGLSGNTGFSSEPHLHFCVFRNRRKGMALEKETLPVLFQNVDTRFTSPRGSCAPKDVSAPVPKPATRLVLNGIWKQANGRTAIINGEMFKEGDKATVELSPERVEIVCQTIGETSVTVLVAGKEMVELKLKP